MAEQSNSIPIAGLVVVAAFISGTLLAPQALDVLRPSESERVSGVESIHQDIDARLWEDPFAAVRRADDAQAKACNEAAKSDRVLQAKCASADRAREDATRLTKRIKDEHALVIAALVPGNPFVGAEEQRRRFRYALLKGLGSQDYVPEDAEHIGQLLVHLGPKDFELGASESKPETVIDLPYEFLCRDRSVDPTDHTICLHPGRREVAIVLWVDEAALGVRKLHAFASLMSKIFPADGAKTLPTEDGRIKLKVLGPTDSGALRDALADLQAAAASAAKPNALSPTMLRGYRILSGASFFNVNATAPATYLLPEQSVSDPPGAARDATDARIERFIWRNSRAFRPDCEPAGGINCARYTSTINDDGLAVQQITNELCARGLGPRDWLSANARRSGVGPVDGNLKCQPQLGSDHRVVLIGEWDSLYSRTLLNLFEDKLCPGQACIEPYTYLRGLDGVTVPIGHEEGGRADGATTENSSATASPNSSSGRTSPVEWPESRDQRDYVRWLVKELSDSESAATRIGTAGGGEPLPQGKGFGRIDAIGLIGTDVHDKLLLLEALRSRFPDKNIFTTDLDSRYLHPRALPFTRNLLIASAYPLKAGLGIPMRDVYQVSVFEAARSAANDSESPHAAVSLSPSPSMYVIGRTDAHCLPFPQADDRCRPVMARWPMMLQTSAYFLLPVLVLWLILIWPSTPSMQRLVFGPSMMDSEGAPNRQRVADQTSAFMFFAVLNSAALIWLFGSCIEMASPGRVDTSVLRWAFAISTVLLLGLILAANAWDRKVANRSEAKRNDLPWWARFVRLGAAAAALLAPIGLLAFAHRPDPDRVLELVFMSEGVSGWPSQLLRCVAFIVAAAALDRAWFDGRESIQSLQDCLGIGGNRTQTPSADEPGSQAATGKNSWTRMVLLHSWLFMWGYKAKKKGNFQELWDDYLEYGRTRAHAIRILIAAAIFASVAGLIQYWVDEQALDINRLPVRGIEHRQLMFGTQGFAGVALIFCLVTVIDATLLAARFASHLNRDRTVYPPEVLRRFARSLGQGGTSSKWAEPIRGNPANRGEGVPSYGGHSLLDNWIDVQVVAKITEKTGSLILAPFVVLALLLVARSSLFDNWAVTRGLAAVMSGYALLLIAAAVLVKTLAEQTRQWALESMNADLRWLAGAGDGWSALADQFQRMIDAVRGNRTGAFAPFFDQPLVRALLVPLGGVGGSQLLDYFLLAR